jgi:hypothetical protein
MDGYELHRISLLEGRHTICALVNFRCGARSSVRSASHRVSYLWSWIAEVIEAGLFLSPSIGLIDKTLGAKALSGVNLRQYSREGKELWNSLFFG